LSVAKVVAVAAASMPGRARDRLVKRINAAMTGARVRSRDGIFLVVDGGGKITQELHGPRALVDFAVEIGVVIQ